MNFNDLGVIFQTELSRKVRSRPYLIGTVIGAIGILLLASLPTLLDNAFSGATKNIILAGDPVIVAQAKPLLEKDFKIVATEPAPTTQPTIAYLDAHGKASSLVVLERNAHGLAATAYARDPSNFPNQFSRDLVPLSIALATKLPQEQINPLLKFPVEVKSLDAKFADQSSANSAKGIAYILVMLLYVSIIVNAQAVMSSVAEEKTNRIAELLVATTSPALLLTGKVLAAATAGFIQLGVWIGAGYLSAQGFVSLFASNSAHATAQAAAAKAAETGGGLNLGAVDIPSSVIFAFVLFYILGFFQYATMYAAAASLITRTEDLGSVTVPLVLPVVGGFLVAQFALQFPNSPNVVIISQIPLLSPFVMFTRMVVTTVPAWQIVTSLLVNVAAMIAIVWASGKIYRVGLLMYGRMPSLKQVIATLRA